MKSSQMQIREDLSALHKTRFSFAHEGLKVFSNESKWQNVLSLGSV
jgi:hypothetical protein